MESDTHPKSEPSRPLPVAGRWRALGLAGLGVAVVIGTWARVHGLGFSSLAIDEYYFVTSIRRILATGLPEFPSGGYYTRGLLIQYLTAPFIWLTHSDELGVRLPSVLFGLGSAFLGYLYGRRTIGRPWGMALAAILLLSSWEIEFSRFGRMYAGFQFAALALLVSLHDVIGGARGARRFLPPILGLFAVGSHSLSVCLLPFVFLPVLLPGARARFGGRTPMFGYALAATLPVISFLVSRAINFRLIGVANVYPEGFEWSGGAHPLFPAFPFWHVGSSKETVIVLAAALAVVAVAAGVLQSRRRINEATTIAALGLVCAAAHQLLLAGLVLLVLVSRYGLPGSARENRGAFRLGLATVAISAAWVAWAGWLTYGAGSRGWIEAAGVQLFSDAVFRVFVWPDPGPSILSPWWRELPVLSLLFAGALAIQFAARARDPLVDLVRNPAFFVLFLLLFLGLFAPQFSVTRYTYFAYPVALAMLLLSVRDATRFLTRRVGSLEWSPALGIPASLALFALGGDFHPSHLARIASYESTYRVGPFLPYEVTWYDRDDFVATAAFVNDAAAEVDVVIVAEVPSVSHYLSGDHAVYLDRRGSRFVNVSRRGGTLDMWSNRRLLGTPEDLRAFTRCAVGSIWLVQSMDERPWIDPFEVWGDRLAFAETAFVSPDSSSQVQRLRINDEDCTGGADE